MSITQATTDPVTQTSTATKLALKIEVLVIPVSDVDRAKRFYEGPPGSQCSILIGKGLTSAVPGSVKGTFVVVDDIDAARAALIGQGVDVSEVFHFTGGLNVMGQAQAAGRDPQGRSYFSHASFSDPDGNSWLLQEITTRLPGRV
jgi:catechol 2,3-dioxygenase-like lactoylglutathione lyase family enzyme